MSLMRLKEIGEHYGLRACGWKVDPKELPGMPMPAILFVDNRHFVVLDSVDREDRAFVRDPAIGRIRIPGKRLRSRWRGEVLVFTKKELTTAGSRPDSLNKMQKEGITKHVK
jgi:ABC-type bacteriocin/lantibiotic exporter with double-glycine peptidase domain